MEPPEIERLDEQTIQRIAAGEVVERPASVVKELLENSLDAGATRIAVSVAAGGTEGIRVRDDGVGIPADQLEAAVAEHATSKIGDIDDLDAGVATLGFRGEALYTVGGVSRLTVRSKPPDADAGAEISVEGGTVGEVRPAGCPTGTVVEVDDLFYNTPARKKFLKRVTTEFDHVNTVVTSYALANPDVAVSLEHDGRETFATEGNGDLRSAVLAVYGREVAEGMLDVDWRPDEGSADSSSLNARTENGSPSVIRVTGLVSHPETTRASRDYLGTYVNGRYVTASSLREAVLDAYDGQLAPDRYPFTVLFVEVPPDDVDVNVHPRKLEVRFDEEAAVRSAVEDAVGSALLDHGLIRSGAPRGQSAPDEAAVDPEPPGTKAVGGAGIGNTTETNGSDETEQTDPQGSATRLEPDDADAWSVEGIGGGPEPRDAAGEEVGPAGDEEVESAAEDEEVGSAKGGEVGSVGDEDAGSVGDGVSDAANGVEITNTLADTTGSGSGSNGENAASQPSRRRSESHPPTRGESSPRTSTRDGYQSEPTSGPTNQRTLAGNETADERGFESLPRLRVLGQLHETYVIAEASDGLVLIDQHAADERVNYERLKREFADGAPAQALAEPVSIELTAREAALFGEFVDDLAEIGFRAERAGDREVVVEAVPAVFDAALDPELLRDALSAFVSDAVDAESEREADGTLDADGVGRGDGSAGGNERMPEPVTAVVDELLADLACYPSVTGNTSLTEGRVLDLLDRLDDCENPYACPHGRPVIIRIDREEIGSRFERDYPGHAGRRAE